MKKIIFLLLFLNSLFSLAQAPIIEGNEIVCWNTNGMATVTNGVTYDSYQWYMKYSYDEDAPFEIITGANTNTLTYGMDYNEYTIKLVTILNGVPYESNHLDLGVLWSFGVIFESEFSSPTGHSDEFGNHFCQGDSIQLTVLGLFNANVQWYKDDLIMEGENSDTLTVTEPGYYHAVCSTEDCPEDYQYSLGFNALYKDCHNLNNENNTLNNIQIYPNPTNDLVYFENSKNAEITKYEIFSVDGKKLISKEVSESTKSISLESLATGSYLLKFYGKNQVGSRKIIKK